MVPKAGAEVEICRKVEGSCGDGHGVGDELRISDCVVVKAGVVEIVGLDDMFRQGLFDGGFEGEKKSVRRLRVVMSE